LLRFIFDLFEFMIRFGSYSMHLNKRTSYSFQFEELQSLYG